MSMITEFTHAPQVVTVCYANVEEISQHEIYSWTRFENQEIVGKPKSSTPVGMRGRNLPLCRFIRQLIA